MIDCRPLRIPAFRRLWVASAVTAVGGSFSLIAVPAQLYALTGSSTAVGAAAGVSMGSLILAALWSGTLADAMDRRRLLLAGHAGLGLAHVGLWLNGALGFGSVPAVLVLAAVQGLGFGTVMTVAGAAVPRLVPSALLVAANSLTSLTRHTGAVAGPLLAGVLIPLAGLDTLYLLDALALTGMLWAVGRLPAMRPAGPVERAGLGEGFRQVARHRVLVAVLAVDLAAMVFSLPFALYPELAAGVYGGPAGGGMELGLLYAAYPAGVIMVGLVSGTFSRARRHGALMASAAMAWGGCAVLLGLATDLWPALAALVAGGGVNFVLSTFRNAISQAYTDDALRGRIQGALVVVVMGGPQLANLVHGLAGAGVGARVAIGAGGALTVVTVALLVRVVPELWRYDARSVREREGEPGGAKATRPAPNPETLGAQAKPSEHGGGDDPRPVGRRPGPRRA